MPAGPQRPRGIESLSPEPSSERSSIRTSSPSTENPPRTATRRSPMRASSSALRTVTAAVSSQSGLAGSRRRRSARSRCPVGAMVTPSGKIGSHGEARLIVVSRPRVTAIRSVSTRRSQRPLAPAPTVPASRSRARPTRPRTSTKLGVAAHDVQRAGEPRDVEAAVGAVVAEADRDVAERDVPTLGRRVVARGQVREDVHGPAGAEERPRLAERTLAGLARLHRGLERALDAGPARGDAHASAAGVLVDRRVHRDLGAGGAALRADVEPATAVAPVGERRPHERHARVHRLELEGNGV